MDNLLPESISIRILDKPGEMKAVEELQAVIWAGSPTEIVPGHLLLTVSHHGGLVIGAIAAGDRQLEANPTQGSNRLNLPSLPTGEGLVGFVFGFPGLEIHPEKLELKHCSHMLGVHPNFENQGIGFRLKRAQWQMVRRTGVDRMIWTFDPLLSRNAYLNICRLGAVCNTYLREAYGELRDDINSGLATDRFQVDWWLNSNRVNRKLSKRPRVRLGLVDYLTAGVDILNSIRFDPGGLPHPEPEDVEVNWNTRVTQQSIYLVEVPADFQRIKRLNHELAYSWRMHTRTLFEKMFSEGFLVTDFVYEPKEQPRSYYVLSYGESTL